MIMINFSKVQRLQSVEIPKNKQHCIIYTFLSAVPFLFDSSYVTSPPAVGISSVLSVFQSGASKIRSTKGIKKNTNGHLVSLCKARESSNNDSFWFLHLNHNIFYLCVCVCETKKEATSY